MTIISADNWEGGPKYAHDRGCVFVHSRDKLSAVEAPYIAIGDDVWDIDMLRNATMAFCPSDAFSIVREIDHINVLETKGGQGVIAELLLRLV